MTCSLLEITVTVLTLLNKTIFWNSLVLFLKRKYETLRTPKEKTHLLTIVSPGAHSS